MKKLITAAMLIIAALPVVAADKPATPQQQRMRDCNADAKDMKGQERKDFMKQCLSGKQSANKTSREERRAENQTARDERRADNQAARQTQQDRMKTCNADATAKGLKGDVRKAFMSDCLKN